MIKKIRRKKNVIDRNFTDIEKPMTGEDIAKYFGVGRQAISNTLKRALGKTYYGMKKLNNTSPFETMVYISIGLEVSENEMKKFFMLFPPKIRTEIEKDAETFQL